MGKEVDEKVEKEEKPDIDRGFVNITIDDVKKKIRRGKHTVVELKNLGDVPLAYDLEQIVNGKMVLLPDDGEVKIKGEEVFVSHPKDGGSS